MDDAFGGTNEPFDFDIQEEDTANLDFDGYENFDEYDQDQFGDQFDEEVCQKTMTFF